MGNEMKSETHLQVEKHLGKPISHDEYRNGLIQDQYGRDVKIGRMIKDKTLQNKFANDPVRQGKRLSGLVAHITRSPIGVAGQTSGNQSWASGSTSAYSCKDVDEGINKHYLEKEIQHGTVVGYLKDQRGRELSRITLQPHINNKGHRAYAIDAQYGVNHPQFVKHMENVASQLSGEHKGGSMVYYKHEDVYNDNRKEELFHPNATADHITKALDDKNEDIGVKYAAIKHPNATADHITQVLNNKNENIYIRKAAIQHPKVTAEHITQVLNDKNEDEYVRRLAIRHPNATADHITQVLNDKDEYIDIKKAAIKHPNATADHITQVLNNKNENVYVRTAAIRHPNATADHITQVLNDKDEDASVLRIAFNRNNLKDFKQN
jgi:desulfoferrodoxin (superoxide reductase-like protein)